jgi:hypothetical protein
MSVALVDIVKRASIVNQSSWSWSLATLGVPSTWVDYLGQYVEHWYHRWFILPVAKLYLWGPGLGGWGFWGGMDMSEICAHKTTLNSAFWRQHPDECAEIVSRHVYSVAILIETIVYFYLMGRLLKLGMSHLTRHKQTSPFSSSSSSTT